MTNLSPTELAAALRAHNAWRRGEGEEDDAAPVQAPYGPTQLGEIIDRAAAELEHFNSLDMRFSMREPAALRDQLAKANAEIDRLSKRTAFVEETPITGSDMQVIAALASVPGAVSVLKPDIDSPA